MEDSRDTVVVDEPRPRSSSFLNDFLSKSMHRMSLGAPKGKSYPKGSDVFRPHIAEDDRSERINSWRLAIERSMKWTKITTQEEKRFDYRRRSTIPVGVYLLSSFGILVLSNYYAHLK